MTDNISDETKEVQRNVSTEVAPELIPFHALPIYKKSTDFILTDDEKSVIVDGEFRKALSKQGNAISKSAEILDNEKLARVKTVSYTHLRAHET